MQSEGGRTGGNGNGLRNRSELVRCHGDSIVDGGVEGEHQRLGHVRCRRSVVELNDHDESATYAAVGEVDHFGLIACRVSPILSPMVPSRTCELNGG